LWEQTGVPVALCSPLLAPDWTSADVKGETLWPEPAGANVIAESPPSTPPADGVSFS
jgi:hypothetical protein